MKDSIRWRVLASGAVALLALSACGSSGHPPDSSTGQGGPEKDSAAAVEKFYSENDVRFISGGGPGGGAYGYAELIARFMGKYIPGNPRVTVEGRPGAGTMINANQLFNKDPQDGTVLGNIHANLMIAEASGIEQAKFSFKKFGIVGSPDNAFLACGAHKRSGITDIQQLIDGKELIVGASQPGSGNHDTPAVLNEVLGTKFHIIPGYDAGGGPIQLAIERREVDGGCGTFSTFQTAFSEMIDNGTMKLLVTIGKTPSNHPWLKDVPRAEDLADTDEGKALLNLVGTPTSVNWPVVTPPNVPKERLEALRTALMQTLKDPKFLVEAAKADLTISPQDHEAVLAAFDKVLATPQDVLDRFTKLTTAKK